MQANKKIFLETLTASVRGIDYQMQTYSLIVILNMHKAFRESFMRPSFKVATDWLSHKDPRTDARLVVQ